MLFNVHGPFAVPTAGLYYITLLRSCQHFFQNFFQAARPKSLFCFFSAALTRQPWYHITLSCICQHFFWKLLSGRQARPPFPFVVLSLAKQLSYNTTPLPLCQLFFAKKLRKTYISFFFATLSGEIPIIYKLYLILRWLLLSKWKGNPNLPLAFFQNCGILVLFYWWTCARSSAG